VLLGPTPLAEQGSLACEPACDSASLVPLLTSGDPDVVGLRARGDGQRADLYERRLRAVFELRARLRTAAPGNRGATWEAVAAQHGVRVSMLRRLDLALRREGYTALVPVKGLALRGRSRAIPQELQRILLDLYCCGARLGADHLMRAAAAWCQERRLPVPSMRTIQRFVASPRNVPPLLRVASRDGRRTFEEKMSARLTRDPASVEPGSWLCFDHRLADTLVLVPDGQGQGWPAAMRRLPCPCGSGSERGKCCSAKRPWWTAGADVATGAIVAVRVSLQPNSTVVCSAIRDAILAWGAPDTIYRDNGKDFQAHLFDGEGVDFARPDPKVLKGHKRWPAAAGPDVEGNIAWQVLGIKFVNAVPYSAWSKPVEAIFGAFARRFERLLPGWTGSRPADRPEKLKSELQTGTMLALKEYVETLRKAVEIWNTERPIGERDAPPLELWKSRMQPPNIVPKDALTFLLQRESTQTVRQGKIKVAGRDYMSNALALLTERKLLVRYDTEHPEEVFVYAPDGTCLCVPQLPRAAFGLWGESNVRAAAARRAQREHVRDLAVQIKGTATDLKDPLAVGEAIRKRLAVLTVATVRGRMEGQARAHEAAGQPEAADAPPARPDLTWRDIENLVKRFERRGRTSARGGQIAVLLRPLLRLGANLYVYMDGLGGFLPTAQDLIAECRGKLQDPQWGAAARMGGAEVHDFLAWFGIAVPAPGRRPLPAPNPDLGEAVADQVQARAGLAAGEERTRQNRERVKHILADAAQKRTPTIYESDMAAFRARLRAKAQ
jgi:hypothetical protein